MTQGNKSLNTNGLTIPNTVLLLSSFAMICVSAYLTKHYFDLKFPTGLANSNNLCNISEYWNCDKTSLSAFGSIFNIPTSFFGILMGLLGMISAMAGNLSLERVSKIVFTANFAGSIFLFFYSVFTLGGLCPMCTVYYFLAGINFFLYFKFSEGFQIEPKAFALTVIAGIVPLIGMNQYHGSKYSDQKNLSGQYIAQFNQLKDYGQAAFDSPYRIHSATEKFADAPIQITIYSDFQCPFCKLIADVTPSIISEVKDKVNVQYMFYPLDKNCNKKMERGMHPYACKAAYLSACDPSKFLEIHDHIFKHQAKLSNEFLAQTAKKFGLDPKCMDDPKNKELVVKAIESGDKFKVKSTPTMIVNGRKLEGMIPTIHMKAILKSLLK